MNKRLWTENLIDFAQKRLRPEEAGNLTTKKPDEAETDIFASRDDSDSHDDGCGSDDDVDAEQDLFEEDAAVRVLFYLFIYSILKMIVKFFEFNTAVL